MEAQGRSGTGTAARSTLAYTTYYTEVQSDGPHLRGYQYDDYERVLADARTRYVRVMAEDAAVDWPVLADIEHNTEYVPEYFRLRYGKGTPIYYLSLPSPQVIERSEGARASLAQHLADLTREGAWIVLDEQVGKQDTAEYIKGLVADTCPQAALDEDALIDPTNQSPAAVFYFHAALRSSHLTQLVLPPPPSGVLREEYRRQLWPGGMLHGTSRETIILDPDQLDGRIIAPSAASTFSQLWEIYSTRFDDLIRHYPLRGEQTRDELEAMLRDEATVTAAHEQDGRITSFLFATDVHACNWLNERYFRKYADGTILCFPGIVADKKHQGSASLALISLMCHLINLSIPRLHLVFQCTNVSRDYIPKIMELVVRRSGLRFESPVEPVATYRCVSLRVRLA